MARRKDITIRFCLSKGDGEQIEVSRFSKKEGRDIRICLTMLLNYVPEQQPNPKILSVQIIHDGITPLKGEIEGYVFNRNCDYPLDGYPTPVVRFLLDRAMDPQEFLIAVFESSYRVSTEAMRENGDDPYFAEDHNGYSSILSPKERDGLVSLLKERDVYSGKIFEFSDGMPENGLLIPAIEFALKPGRRSSKDT
jgi:hypothetical protein